MFQPLHAHILIEYAAAEPTLPENSLPGAFREHILACRSRDPLGLDELVAPPKTTVLLNTSAGA